jgi:hypothetical protein
MIISNPRKNLFQQNPFILTKFNTARILLLKI